MAAAHFEEALALWPEDDDERAGLLFRRARALYEATDDRREQALDEAREALLAVGETELAAETEAFLALVSWYRGHGEATRAHLSRAEELAGDSVSPSGARVLAVSARTLAIAGQWEDGKRVAEAALEIAEALQLDELRAHTLTTIGMAKNFLGDLSGVEDMERALELALEIDSPVASTIVNNLAVEAWLSGDVLARRGSLRGSATARRAPRRCRKRALRQSEPRLERPCAWTVGRRAPRCGQVHRRVRGGLAPYQRGVHAHPSRLHSASPRGF